MKNTGMGLTITGVWTVCLAVGSEPIAVEAGIAGLVILVAGLAMVLYQSYREEELAEERRMEEKRRRRQQEKQDAMFQKWKTSTNLKEGSR